MCGIYYSREGAQGAVFYEIFYPKEMREVIADLRAKGDLNDCAMASVRYDLNICLLFFAVVLGGMLLFDYDNLHMTPLISLMFLVVMIIMTWSKYFRNMKPYLIGMKRSGVVVEDSSIYFGVVVFVKEKFNDTRFKIYLGSVYGKVVPPDIGEEISFFASDNGSKYAMPCSSIYMDEYCLSLKLIEGNKNE